MSQSRKNMPKLLLEQESVIQSITNLVPHLKSRKNFPAPLLRERLQMLKANWERCRQLNVSLELMFTEEDAELPYVADKHFRQAENAYEGAVDFLLEKMPDENSSSTIAANENSPHRSRLKKPPVSLPTFSGKYTEWLFFRELFSSLVVDDYLLTDIERLQYLMTSLTGEAQVIVKDLPLTGESFNLAWNKLKNRYNNDRALIEDCMRKLRELPDITSDFLNGLKNLRDTSTSVLTSLKTLKRPVEHWDDWLVSLLASKFDKQSRRDWEMYIDDSTDMPTFTEFETFLQTRIRVLESISLSSKPLDNKITKGSQKEVKGPSVHVHQTNKKKIICPFCQGDHKIYICKPFQELTVSERNSFISKNSHCTNCLGKNHSHSNCLSKGSCKFCGRKHHYLLHRDNKNNIPETNNFDSSASSSKYPPESTEPLKSTVTNHLNSTKQKRPSSILLATARVLIQADNGRQTFVRALLDQGSEASFVTESVVQLLHISRSRVSTTISGMGGASIGNVSHSVNFSIKSNIEEKTELNARALVVSKISDYVPKRFALNQNLSHVQNLKLADPYFSSADRIELLIGADLYGSILRDGVRQGLPGTPTAQFTIFGWVLSGPTTSSSDFPPSLHVNHAFEPSLIDSLQKFWSIEEPITTTHLSKEDLDCAAHFDATHSRDENGRYCVSLPFREPASTLGNSQITSLSSFFRLEKKLQSNLEIKDKYNEFLEEYETLGHMTRLEANEMCQPTRVYIPHQPVLRDSSSTTKLRVVFNASAPTSNGKSLNQVLHIGPKLQPDLTSIILRWRVHRFVLSADIEKMFRQINVDPKDRKYQCILWRKNLNEPVGIYELNTVTYGTSCAPYLAIRVMQQLVQDEGHKFPLAASIFKNNTYVDDLFFGAEDLILAKRMRDQAIQLASCAGLTLRKWSSNSSALLSDLNPKDHGLAFELPLKESTNLQVLGITWNPQLDSFKFQVKPFSSENPTKRSILSSIAQLFDPLGWLAPIIVTAKILLQSLWLVHVSWDEPLPKDIQQTWKKFSQNLHFVSEISIPRWIHCDGDVFSIELHGFSDASKSAYSAAVYARVVSITGNTHVNLLAAKTKVAPIKTLSIARLELCAASLLSKLIRSIQSALQLNGCPLFCWTDSTIVLSWLQKQPATWTVFVANRVSEIQVSIPTATWRYVPSAENPADCASRGKLASDLVHFSLWWHGPSWLSLSTEFWPNSKPHITPNFPETRKNIHTHTTQISWDLPTRFSSWARLLRVTGYIFKFVNPLLKMIKFKKLTSTPLVNDSFLPAASSKSDKSNLILTADEISHAAEFWIKRTQQQAFAHEIHCVSSNLKIPKSSKLRKLNPILDSSQVLRLGGRLSHSTISPKRKFPVILPPGTIANLIISQIHINLLHSGTQLTLGVLRERFWILGARTLVKKMIQQCVICTRFAANTGVQFMADLPSARCSESRAFLHTGVDYAGPILVRYSPGRGSKSHKAYIAVFVCFSTRAIHLEIVNDYTTGAFLAAFKRFTSRRGIPSDVYSDNGTNFRGAERELFYAFKTACKNPDVLSYVADDGVNWHFSPPSAPHFGGLWEAGVKSMKKHLHKLLRNLTPTNEELNTLITQIEGCLNSRPIAPLSDDPESFEILTPGHFLIGTSLATVPTPSVIDLKDNRLSRWQTYQKLLEQFWRRWAREYLSTLQERHKWFTRQPNLLPGTLVLLKNGNLPPTKWEMARVTSCAPGSDGLVRVVTVKTAKSSFVRPISQLCVLPIPFHKTYEND